MDGKGLNYEFNDFENFTRVLKYLPHFANVISRWASSIACEVGALDGTTQMQIRKFFAENFRFASYG